MPVFKFNFRKILRENLEKKALQTDGQTDEQIQLHWKDRPAEPRVREIFIK